MKSVICALMVSGGCAAFEEDGAWVAFKSRFGKHFNSQNEETARYWIFKDNLEHIEANNAQLSTYHLAVNSFSDLTFEEFKTLYLGAKPLEGLEGLEEVGQHYPVEGETLATSLDWVSKGAVTAVKNQGSCGSCWSFSATGTIEGAWEVASGKLVSISESQFVDCSSANYGCSGGWPSKAIAFAEDVDLCTEDSYSYVAKDRTCNPSGCTVAIPKGGVTGYKTVASSEAGLLSALNLMPVSICLDADRKFMQYGGGVFQKTCGTSINHAVLAVGYGTDGVDYWKVKNSWGTGWGEAGYIRMIRGIGGSGKCGMLSNSHYPVVNTDASVMV